MMKDNINLLPKEFSERVFQFLEASAKPIILTVDVLVIKAEFADGQRLLINFNPQTGKIWLAGHSVAAEFVFNGERWISQQDGREFFECFEPLVAEFLSSSALNNMPGRLQIINQVKRPSAQSIVVEPLQSNSPAWLYLLLLVPVLYFGYRHFNKSSQALNPIATAPLSEIQTHQQTGGLQSCESIQPQNGAGEVFFKSGAYGSERTDVKISNEHHYDVLVLFVEPSSSKPLSSLLVKAKNTANASMATGKYDLLFSTGNTWCNLQIGFKDGSISKLDNRFEFFRQIPAAISLQSTGSKPADFNVYLRSHMESPAIPEQHIGSGVMELQQAKDGHYYIQGSIAGNPITFLVDTGASVTTIKQNLAIIGGIKNCKATQSNTANGVVDVCVGTIAEIRIGAYVINNATVVANPKTDVNLLGMNVLNQFQISTEKGVMRLSKP